MECPHLPEIEYSEFSRELHQKVAARRIPISCSLELTFRCNLRCAHCYIDHKDLQNELSREEINDLLDQMVDEGTLWLLLTGGEPFIRKDFIDIYLDIKRKGFLITLFTNGTLITPEVADLLSTWPPFSVEITLYGATRETYEAVTAVPGSYERCVRSINLLVEKGIPLKLKSMILTLNRNDLEGMKDIADQLGLGYRFDPVINPGLDGSKEPAKVALKPEEVVELDINDPERLKAWQTFLKEFGGPPPDSSKVYSCGAGIEGFHIDPYGRMTVCILAREPSYDLRTGSIKEGWRDFIPKVRAQKRRHNYPCYECDMIALCGQCPGWAQLENGDQERPVEYLCRIAHLRAEAFGMERNKSTKLLGLV